MKEKALSEVKRGGVFKLIDVSGDAHFQSERIKSGCYGYIFESDGFTYIINPDGSAIHTSSIILLSWDTVIEYYGAVKKQIKRKIKKAYNLE